MANGRLTKEDFEPDFLAELGKGGTHAERTDNPHNVTKVQVGLGNVDNTSDLNKPVSTAQQAAIDGIDVVEKLGYTPESISKKGIANGYAGLDESGKVPDTQLPPLDYIPTSQKGVADGVAALGSDGKVPSTQIPNITPTIPDASTSQKGIVQLNDSLSSTSITQAATANAVKQVNDAKVNRQQEDWIIGTTVNGWTATPSLKYMKDEMGFVHVNVEVTGGIKSIGTKIFELPVGYRPKSYELFGLPTYDNATNGRIVTAYFSGGGLTLNGTPLDKIIIRITFKAEG